MKITVHGMMCMHCVKSVTDALNALEGVSEVSVELSSGVVTLKAEEALRTTIVQTVEDLGFDVEE